MFKKTVRMSSQARGLLTPGASRKRKEREPTSQKPLVKPTAVSGSTSRAAAPQLTCSNRLLAGYMAHEFLSKGTLLGHKFDPARLEVDTTVERRSQPSTYDEVANLLKSDGAHIPGVVNPTHLTRWIQMI